MPIDLSKLKSANNPDKKPGQRGPEGSQATQVFTRLGNAFESEGKGVFDAFNSLGTGIGPKRAEAIAAQLDTNDVIGSLMQNPSLLDNVKLTGDKGGAAALSRTKQALFDRPFSQADELRSGGLMTDYEHSKWAATPRTEENRQRLFNRVGEIQAQPEYERDFVSRMTKRESELDAYQKNVINPWNDQNQGRSLQTEKEYVGSVPFLRVKRDDLDVRVSVNRNALFINNMQATLKVGNLNDEGKLDVPDMNKWGTARTVFNDMFGPAGDPTKRTAGYKSINSQGGDADKFVYQNPLASLSPVAEQHMRTRVEIDKSRILFDPEHEGAPVHLPSYEGDKFGLLNAKKKGMEWYAGASILDNMGYQRADSPFVSNDIQAMSSIHGWYPTQDAEGNAAIQTGAGSSGKAIKRAQLPMQEHGMIGEYAGQAYGYNAGANVGDNLTGSGLAGQRMSVAIGITGGFDPEGLGFARRGLGFWQMKNHKIELGRDDDGNPILDDATRASLDAGRGQLWNSSQSPDINGRPTDLAGAGEQFAYNDWKVSNIGDKSFVEFENLVQSGMPWSVKSGSGFKALMQNVEDLGKMADEYSNLDMVMPQFSDANMGRAAIIAAMSPQEYEQNIREFNSTQKVQLDERGIQQYLGGANDTRWSQDTSGFLNRMMTQHYMPAHTREVIENRVMNRSGVELLRNERWSDQQRQNIASAMDIGVDQIPQSPLVSATQRDDTDMFDVQVRSHRLFTNINVGARAEIPGHNSRVSDEWVNSVTSAYGDEIGGRLGAFAQPEKDRHQAIMDVAYANAGQGGLSNASDYSALSPENRGAYLNEVAGLDQLSSGDRAKATLDAMGRHLGDTPMKMQADGRDFFMPAPSSVAGMLTEDATGDQVNPFVNRYIDTMNATLNRTEAGAGGPNAHDMDALLNNVDETSSVPRSLREVVQTAGFQQGMTAPRVKGALNLFNMMSGAAPIGGMVLHPEDAAAAYAAGVNAQGGEMTHAQALSTLFERARQNPDQPVSRGAMARFPIDNPGRNSAAMIQDIFLSTQLAGQGANERLHRGQVMTSMQSQEVFEGDSDADRATIVDLSDAKGGMLPFTPDEVRARNSRIREEAIGSTEQGKQIAKWLGDKAMDDNGNVSPQAYFANLDKEGKGLFSNSALTSEYTGFALGAKKGMGETYNAGRSSAISLARYDMNTESQGGEKRAGRQAETRRAWADTLGTTYRPSLDMVKNDQTGSTMSPGLEQYINLSNTNLVTGKIGTNGNMPGILAGTQGEGSKNIESAGLIAIQAQLRMTELGSGDSFDQGVQTATMNIVPSSLSEEGEAKVRDVVSRARKEVQDNPDSDTGPHHRTTSSWKAAEEIAGIVKADTNMDYHRTNAIALAPVTAAAEKTVRPTEGKGREEGALFRDRPRAGSKPGSLGTPYPETSTVSQDLNRLAEIGSIQRAAKRVASSNIGLSVEEHKEATDMLRSGQGDVNRMQARVRGEVAKKTGSTAPASAGSTPPPRPPSNVTAAAPGDEPPDEEGDTTGGSWAPTEAPSGQPGQPSSPDSRTYTTVEGKSYTPEEPDSEDIDANIDAWAANNNRPLHTASNLASARVVSNGGVQLVRIAPAEFGGNDADKAKMLHGRLLSRAAAIANIDPTQMGAGDRNLVTDVHKMVGTFNRLRNKASRGVEMTGGNMHEQAVDEMFGENGSESGLDTIAQMEKTVSGAGGLNEVVESDKEAKRYTNKAPVDKAAGHFTYDDPGGNRMIGAASNLGKSLEQLTGIMTKAEDQTQKLTRSQVENVEAMAAQYSALGKQYSALKEGAAAEPGGVSAQVLEKFDKGGYKNQMDALGARLTDDSGGASILQRAEAQRAANKFKFEEPTLMEKFTPFLQRGKAGAKAMEHAEDEEWYGKDGSAGHTAWMIGGRALAAPASLINNRYAIRGIQQEFIDPLLSARSSYLQYQESGARAMMNTDFAGGISGNMAAYTDAVRPGIQQQQRELALGRAADRGIGGFQDMMSKTMGGQTAADFQAFGSTVMAGASIGGLATGWNPLGIAAGAAAGATMFGVGQIYGFQHGSEQDRTARVGAIMHGGVLGDIGAAAGVGADILGGQYGRIVGEVGAQRAIDAMVQKTPYGVAQVSPGRVQLTGNGPRTIDNNAMKLMANAIGRGGSLRDTAMQQAKDAGLTVTDLTSQEISQGYVDSLFTANASQFGYLKPEQLQQVKATSADIVGREGIWAQGGQDRLLGIAGALGRGMASGADTIGTAAAFSSIQGISAENISNQQFGDNILSVDKMFSDPNRGAYYRRAAPGIARQIDQLNSKKRAAGLPATYGVDDVQSIADKIKDIDDDPNMSPDQKAEAKRQLQTGLDISGIQADSVGESPIFEGTTKGGYQDYLQQLNSQGKVGELRQAQAKRGMVRSIANSLMVGQGFDKGNADQTAAAFLKASPYASEEAQMSAFGTLRELGAGMTEDNIRQYTQQATVGVNAMDMIGSMASARNIRYGSKEWEALQEEQRKAFGSETLQQYRAGEIDEKVLDQYNNVARGNGITTRDASFMAGLNPTQQGMLVDSAKSVANLQYATGLNPNSIGFASVQSQISGAKTDAQISAANQYMTRYSQGMQFVEQRAGRNVDGIGALRAQEEDAASSLSGAAYQAYLLERGGDPIAMSQAVSKSGMTVENAYRYQVQTGGSQGGTVGAPAGWDEKLNTLQGQRYAAMGDKFGSQGRKYAALAGMDYDKISGMNTVETESEMGNIQFDLTQYQQQVTRNQIGRRRSTTTGVGLSALRGQISAAGGDEYSAGAIASGGEWGLEDAQRGLSWRQQDYSYQMQGRQLDLSQQRFGLAGQQFTENQALKQQQFTVQSGWQQNEMNINQSQARQQSQWGLDDLAYSRNMSSVQFGYNMVDADESVRYSTGRDRRTAMRHRDEAVVTHSMEMGHMDVQEDRAKTQIKWQEDLFSRQRIQFDQNKQWTQQSIDMDRRHFDQNRQLEQQSMAMDRESYNQQRQFQLEGRALEMESRALRRAMFLVEQKEQEDLNTKATQASNSLAALAQHIDDVGRSAASASQQSSYQAATTGVPSSSYNPAPTQAASRQTVSQGSPAVPQAAREISHTSSASTAQSDANRLLQQIAQTGYHFWDGGQVPLRQFSDGGSTGVGHKYQPMGVVHGGEWVVPQNGSLVSHNPNSERLLERIANKLDAIHADGGNAIININNGSPATVGKQASSLYEKSWSK